MQRENNILKTTHKDAFAMIGAIVVVLVVSAIMTLSIMLTTQTTKRTVDLYLYEQAVLYSKSAAELALLDIAREGCKNSYNTTFDGIYDANVTMLYIYGSTQGSCSDYFNITAPEQNGSVLMDITISVRADANITSEPIRYFRRTMQKL